MGVRQKKVLVHDLEIGMFVSDLDRPWHQTPFPIQGFRIRSQDDIRALTSHCSSVFVDVAESRDTSSGQEGRSSGFGRTVITSAGNDKGRPEIKLAPLNIREPVHYEKGSTLRKELKVSRKLMANAEASLLRAFDSVRSTEVPDLTEVAKVMKQVVSSVLRNPDAMLWLSRTRQHDDYTYQHSLDTSVWALVCGRELGLNEGLLNQLGLGCLLSQVGKLALPEHILANEGRLNAEDYATYRTYVEKGVESLKDTGVSRAVLSVVQGHRERHNGSGFPDGIRGDRVPLLAKIAGIAEYFESLIGPRKPAEPMTPSRAVGLLYELRNIEFQEDLVEKFITAVGVYPTGSLVQLNNGHRGVVVSHSPERRLWPKVMLLTDQAQVPLKMAKIVDLANYNDGKDASVTITITECLPQGTDGLYPERYDVTGAETRWAISNMLRA